MKRNVMTKQNRSFVSLFLAVLLVVSAFIGYMPQQQAKANDDLINPVVPEWLTTQFASGKMGAVLVTVNTSYRASELEYLLKQSDCTTLLLMDQFKAASYIEMLYDIIPDCRENAGPIL